MNRQTQNMQHGLVIWDRRTSLYVVNGEDWTANVDKASVWPNDELSRQRIHARAERRLGHDDFEVYLVRRGTDTIREMPRPEVSDG